jgi:glycosyltransferase involved in cell wall biosynthesis
MTPPTLRVGVDARPAAETPAGRGRYVRELLRHVAALDEPVDLVPYGRFRPAPGELGSDLEWRVVRAPAALWPVAAGRRAGRECDVVLATSSYLLAAGTRTATVPVVYDLVPFRRELRPPHGALAERATLPLAVRRAAAIVAISHATRDELVERFPRAAGRTHVVAPAADASFSSGPADAATLARHGIEGPYVLALGTLEPRKNLPRLLEAFGGLPADLRDRFRLVAAGLRGWAAGETEAALRALGDRVVVPGYVPDADLPALYRGATLFCYPSLHEGFGLPVLEAMQCGVPVLTSSVSSLPEVGGEAVAYVEPFDVGHIRSQLERLLRDPGERQRLAALGPERAARFSWTRSARELVGLLDDVAGR